MEPALVLGLTITAAVLIVYPLGIAGWGIWLLSVSGLDGSPFTFFFFVWFRALWKTALVLLVIWGLVGMFLLILNVIS